MSYASSESNRNRRIRGRIEGTWEILTHLPTNLWEINIHVIPISIKTHFYCNEIR
jgi:hypothetical protein